MKEETKEWMKRAEEDLRVAKREARVIDEPSYSAVCFQHYSAIRIGRSAPGTAEVSEVV